MELNFKIYSSQETKDVCLTKKEFRTNRRYINYTNLMLVILEKIANNYRSKKLPLRVH